jgi:hypothetical protein
MINSRERGYGTGGPARGARRVRSSAVRVVRWIGQRASSTEKSAENRTLAEASFERHVDQALSVVRQLPALRVVPAAHAQRALRS